MTTKQNPEALQALVLALSGDIRKLTRQVQAIEDHIKVVTTVQQDLATVQHSIMERLEFIEGRVLRRTS